MRGKRVLVTGGTGGIGKETARGLARLGAHVVLVGRDPGRAETAADELRRDTGNRRIDALTADVTRQEDLHRLAGQAAERYDGLHVLINNVGVNMARRELTVDGVETAFAANVLAPFTLTRLLTPLLRAAAPARVVNITGGIPRGPIDLDNLQGERRYLGWTFTQYNHTKVIMMAMSHVFAERVAGTGVTVNVAYPGHAYTPGNRATPMRAFPLVYRPLVPLIRLLGPVLLADLARPARSSLRLASSAEVEGVNGTYFGTDGEPTPWPASVRDERNRRAVWELCERLGGVDVAW
ncbi:SDR family NAD(P)-dependent oxidoreductase [Streptosporangium sp. NPDC002524]|uniref:SDR family NAD(P)-dependent oxidoreductase n=1 Tax=Streptosporangium sp. NPDC002524 TaxID=3154537 RepID=UPI003333B799